MAYIGLQHIMAAPIEKENENAMPTYGAGVLLGRGINADVTFNRADVTLEADDATVEICSIDRKEYRYGLHRSAAHRGCTH